LAFFFARARRLRPFFAMASSSLLS
jgi:hypothetical protein